MVNKDEYIMPFCYHYD